MRKHRPKVVYQQRGNIQNIENKCCEVFEDESLSGTLKLIRLMCIQMQNRWALWIGLHKSWYMSVRQLETLIR